MNKENRPTAEPVAKTSYMAELRRRLAALPEEEMEAALTYYEEYFDDAGTEDAQRVLAELGPVAALAEQILSGYSRDYLDAVPRSSSTQVPARPEEAAEARRRDEAREEKRREEERAKSEAQSRESAAEPKPGRRSGGSALLIALLVIFALPLLIPLVVAVVATGFSLVAAAFAVAVAIGALVLGLLVAGVVLLAAGLSLLVIHTLEALVACGVGLAFLGAGILLLLLCIFVFAKIVPAVIRLTVQIIRWPFERRVVRA